MERAEARVASLPKAVQDMTRAGLQAVVDYQGVDYGKEYLDACRK